MERLVDIVVFLKDIWISDDLKCSGVTRRSKGGAIHRAPNHCSGRRMTAGAPKSPNNATSTFFNTVHLLSKDLRFEHVPNLLFAPGAIQPSYATAEENLGSPHNGNFLGLFELMAKRDYV